MLPTVRAKPSLVVAAAAVLAASMSAWAEGAGGRSGATDWAWLVQLLDLARNVAERVEAWVVSGYARRPAVMIGLAGVLLLPPLLVLGWLIHGQRAPEAALAADVASGIEQQAHPRLELDGAGAIALPAGRDLVQIGRQDDNDICIEDETVHRYHAVIERTVGGRFAIVDVSGPDGNGLLVNGERRTSAVLMHGDRLELGKTRMRFATAA